VAHSGPVLAAPASTVCVVSVRALSTLANLQT
jgi:hypothetical protein